MQNNYEDIGNIPAHVLATNESALHICNSSSAANDNNFRYSHYRIGDSSKSLASRCKAVSNCRSRSKSKRNKGPWDKMEKEEQYMKLIELRRVATQAKTELKLMKTKVARLERQAKKKDDQVETTLGKAAAAITAALSRDQDKDSNNARPIFRRY